MLQAEALMHERATNLNEVLLSETCQLIYKEVAWPSQVPQQNWALRQRDVTPAHLQSDSDATRFE